MSSNALIEPKFGKDPKRKGQSSFLIFPFFVLVLKLFWFRELGHSNLLLLGLFRGQVRLVGRGPSTLLFCQYIFVPVMSY
jgi:hypothetical protein